MIGDLSVYQKINRLENCFPDKENRCALETSTATAATTRNEKERSGDGKKFGTQLKLKNKTFPSLGFVPPSPSSSGCSSTLVENIFLVIFRVYEMKCALGCRQMTLRACKDKSLRARVLTVSLRDTHKSLYYTNANHARLYLVVSAIM